MARAAQRGPVMGTIGTWSGHLGGGRKGTRRLAPGRGPGPAGRRGSGRCNRAGGSIKTGCRTESAVPDGAAGQGGDPLCTPARERAWGADGASATALQPPPHLLTTLPAPAGGGRCVRHATAATADGGGGVGTGAARGRPGRAARTGGGGHGAAGRARRRTRPPVSVSDGQARSRGGRPRSRRRSGSREPR